mmetsp:Transcript_29663/g.74124  ORF Transcript_29663/g.74124 Transcript_29663/m.74124 type:complete len:241 (-) Transcript_29663:769-1491(-)
MGYGDRPGGGGGVTAVQASGTRGVERHGVARVLRCALHRGDHRCRARRRYSRCRRRRGELATARLPPRVFAVAAPPRGGCARRAYSWSGTGRRRPRRRGNVRLEDRRRGAAPRRGGSAIIRAAAPPLRRACRRSGLPRRRIRRVVCAVYRGGRTRRGRYCGVETLPRWRHHLLLLLRPETAQPHEAGPTLQGQHGPPRPRGKGADGEGGEGCAQGTRGGGRGREENGKRSGEATKRDREG